MNPITRLLDFVVTGSWDLSKNYLKEMQEKRERERESFGGDGKRVCVCLCVCVSECRTEGR